MIKTATVWKGTPYASKVNSISNLRNMCIHYFTSFHCWISISTVHFFETLTNFLFTWSRGNKNLVDITQKGECSKDISFWKFWVAWHQWKLSFARILSDLITIILHPVLTQIIPAKATLIIQNNLLTPVNHLRKYILVGWIPMTGISGS